VQVIYERCAAVDVGKDVIAVAVRTPGKGRDGRKTEKRVYRAFYGVLREMARWLVSLGVTHVAMEATGTYSMPVYYALMESDFEKVLVCNAGHVKNVPGRKTDLADAEWPARCGQRQLTTPPAQRLPGTFKAKATNAWCRGLLPRTPGRGDAGLLDDLVTSLGLAVSR
jgi:transposase